MSAVLRVMCFCLCFCGIVAEVKSEAPFALVARGHSGSIMNYGEIRARLVHGFVQKANEMADAVAVLQNLSKETSALSEQIVKHCSK